MAKDTDEILVGANGTVYVATFGATTPSSFDAALPSATWTDLGYTSEDGVTFTDEKTIEDKRAWQSFYPVRKIITERMASASFALMQWNKNTVQLAFGGGTVSSAGSGYKYTPPDPEDLDERTVVIDWADGTRDYRLVIPRCIVTENVETNVTRTDTAVLPITVGVIGQDGVAPWYLLTDDTAFA